MIMRKLPFYAAFLTIFFGCEKIPKKNTEIIKNKFAILIHGGAGTILKKNIRQKDYNFRLVLDKH